MKTVRTSMSPKRAPVGEKGRRVARIDHFGASGKKSPDGTSLTVPSGRKVMRVVPRDRIPPLIGRDFFILEIEDFLRRNFIIWKKDITFHNLVQRRNALFLFILGIFQQKFLVVVPLHLFPLR